MKLSIMYLSQCFSFYQLRGIVARLFFLPVFVHTHRISAPHSHIIPDCLILRNGFGILIEAFENLE